ncbi:putative calmodulin-binding protein Sha1 [Aspergillus candidus]|uniref:Calponin-homology (CH) domain-containing protein n=1 Tax=Aspergillus candidus TaxID=41067 RepID=A0A2I2F6F8_ASPCN|nr:hypothetical protein BDW47DRAFT_118886 [Aspergillus candidus]PLB36230.1 hypothetical protein BDW47DRAFT_118886 [Aspergillus candidus]
MSGLLEDVGTPCPPKSRIPRLDRCSNRNTSVTSLWDSSTDHGDETCNIDFTMEVKKPVLTGARPKRRTKTGSSFAIHEEDDAKSQQVTNKRRRDDSMADSSVNRKTSLLAQPAQRFRPRVSFAPSPSKRYRETVDPVKPVPTPEATAAANREFLVKINGSARSRPSPRKTGVHRDTVYIPPDETTVASTFMDIFSPVKSIPQQSVPDDSQSNCVKAQSFRRRNEKESRASIHRPPLRPSLKIAQESTTQVDIVGKNGGKENIPPGSVLGEKKVQPYKLWEPPAEDLKASKSVQRNSGDASRQKVVSKPLSTASINGSLQRAVLKTRNKSDQTSTDIVKSNNSVRQKSSSVNLEASTISRDSTTKPLRHSKSTAAIPRTTVSSSVRRLDDEYPLIPDNITTTSMYEEDWIFHQEAVISQLVNTLIGQPNQTSSVDDPAILRHELLGLYQDPSFTHLYKRVQASVLYGAMSIPKDVLIKNSRLTQDLGMKRKFLDFWTRTYDLRALRAAVETITGRRIPTPVTQDAGFDARAASDTKRAPKKKLEGFLDAFLLQNRDTDRSAKETSGRDPAAVGHAYRRTVLRSIMIIILLDKGRMGGTTLPRRLFLASSPFKSSAAVLQGLARFLLPSSGDILKALGHLDCQLVYEQHPLEEYDFRMHNLAVDLRDGVKLTRMVELLYPLTSYSDSITGAADLTPQHGSPSPDRQWPLSQNLKLPCLGRAVKLFNVQIALDALAATPSSRKLVSHVRAEDIVDGHREKTVSLLWGLVSKWGLAKLVDWDDLRKEIDRLTQKAIALFGYEQVSCADWFTGAKSSNSKAENDESISLLTRWVSILAGLKGLHFENLSTSFGDGKIYAAIVDEYEEYVRGDNPSNPSSKSLPKLASRLRALGCSAEFTHLVLPGPSGKTHVLDSDLTTGALAFLCSRLLSASQRARAATVLQNAWRRVLARRELHLRTLAYSVAQHCAAVVQTRDRILWAQKTIARWWKKTKTRHQRRQLLEYHSTHKARYLPAVSDTQ